MPLSWVLGARTDASARRAYFATLARNTRILERTREVLDAAEARRLTLLPYKGALFAGALYADVGARPMSDVDLLVHPADLGRAEALFAELGFTRNYVGRARFRPRHAHDLSFSDGQDPDLQVELHYRLFHELGGDSRVERIFDRAIVVEALGRPRRVPAWDDHLFAVAVHAATHAFGDQPLFVVDLRLLAERAGGVAGARDEARRRRLSVACDTALWLAGLLSSPPRAALARVLGRSPLAAPPSRARSLLVRALATDDPREAAREVARKVELRLVEQIVRLRG